ncbi:UNVERIFIED_CONTAM: protein spotted leaf 11 [Sesamum radiatum]|uniref:Protein spotted leaf 11 n=1 Tax=Sesamum radiatum TaxID=300843 RepID=A0AAW2K2U0_SESRA
MRTIRSNIFQADQSGPIPENSPLVSENLTDSVIDLRLGELANKSSGNSKSPSSSDIDDMLDISRAFTDFSACSSDISGELQRLATVPDSGPSPGPSPESSSLAVKRSAAAKLRLLAKNRADNRALIGESGAVPALIPLLRCSDPITQEHAVTALLNLSLHERNKSLIGNAGAIKSLIYVLKTGTETSKQNAACALLSLALIDENKLSIGACGAIPPLVALLINGKAEQGESGDCRGGVPLVGLVGEQGTGLAEKAMVVLSSLAGIEMGREAIVKEGGIAALVEAIEDGSDKGKEFAVLTLLQLCGESAGNRGLLVKEGGIPPLVALSQIGTAKAKNKAAKLLGYLRESRLEASSSASSSSSA